MVPQVISALNHDPFLVGSRPRARHLHAPEEQVGKSCCDNSDCRPAPYRTTSSGVEMLVGKTWVWVPRAMVEYRSLEGDTGETNGGHWCGERYEGGFVTYCAFLPPSLLPRPNRTPAPVALYLVPANRSARAAPPTRHAQR